MNYSIFPIEKQHSIIDTIHTTLPYQLANLYFIQTYHLLHRSRPHAQPPYPTSPTAPPPPHTAPPSPLSPPYPTVPPLQQIPSPPFTITLSISKHNALVNNERNLLSMSTKSMFLVILSSLSVHF